MSKQFPILEVLAAQRVDQEPLGSKQKFWVSRADGLWLFKYARAKTGEDWSEKVAAEIAVLLGISAARVELANFEGHRGCLCLSFINREKGEALIHGNEVLAIMVSSYEPDKRFGQRQHTIQNVLEATSTLFPNIENFRAAMRQFADYLILDALIGNTDRHHENWGIKLDAHSLKIAPSFDHASSLGRELVGEGLAQALKDTPRYISRGRGGLFLSRNDSRGAVPLNVAIDTAVKFPQHFKNWHARLSALDEVKLKIMFDQVPNSLAETNAKELAIAMVLYARARLLEVLK